MLTGVPEAILTRTDAENRPRRLLVAVLTVDWC